jgi:hypothetical protein
LRQQPLQQRQSFVGVGEPRPDHHGARIGSTPASTPAAFRDTAPEVLSGSPITADSGMATPIAVLWRSFAAGWRVPAPALEGRRFR